LTHFSSNKNESSQRRKGPIPTPLLTTTPNIMNGHSDFESGDETHQTNPTSNGYNNDTFTR
jgi:hypothetical protein